MKRILALVAGLALTGCGWLRGLTPEERTAAKAATVRASIDAGRVGCFTAGRESVALTPAQAEWCKCRNP